MPFLLIMIMNGGRKMVFGLGVFKTMSFCGNGFRVSVVKCRWAFLAHIIFCASCFFSLRSQLIYCFVIFLEFWGFFKDKAKESM